MTPYRGAKGGSALSKSIRCHLCSLYGYIVSRRLKSVVKGSVAKGSVVKGSVAKGSVVKGSVVKGSSEDFVASGRNRNLE